MGQQEGCREGEKQHGRVNVGGGLVVVDGGVWWVGGMG